MSDYNYAAEQIKEGVINHYLKENPGVKRSEVVTKTINGKIVISTIQDTFKNLETRAKTSPQQLKNKKLLDQLAKGGDERYQECLKSVTNSTGYIDWLSISKFTGYTPQDKKDHSDYLSRHSSICSDRALDLYEAKQKFVGVMKSQGKPSRSAVNTILMEYMQSVLGQLKSQKSIYKCEVELGDKFSTAVMNFFQTQFSGLRSRPNPAALRAIARSITILKENQVAVPDIENTKDVKVFNSALEQLQEKLEKRRDNFSNLQKLMDFLEQAIAELKASMEEESPAAADEGSKRRMAFTTRSKGGRR